MDTQINDVFLDNSKGLILELTGDHIILSNPTHPKYSHLAIEELPVALPIGWTNKEGFQISVGELASGIYYIPAGALASGPPMMVIRVPEYNTRTIGDLLAARESKCAAKTPSKLLRGLLKTP